MKRILLIDDDEEILDELELEFQENEIFVIKCNDRAEALAAINNNVPFDAVILDWYFVLDQDSSISKEILRTLNKKCFKPVFIYTGDIEDYENANKSELEFPENLLGHYHKADTDIETLRQRIQELLESNYAVKISSAYRTNIQNHFEKVLFELNELQNVDIARVLNKFYGNGSNVDWSNDIVLNLLHRSLISDETFINGITEILQQANNINQGASANDRKKIANKILYFNSTSDFIRNGDIVKIIEAGGASEMGYGIVITPDCDLENSGCQYIDLIELRRFEDTILGLNADAKRKIITYNHDSYYLFQSLLVGEQLEDFVAVLKSRMVLREQCENYHPNYPKASKRLLYSQQFSYNGTVAEMELLCTKVNPYKAEFLHKLYSSNSRVGIPDIKDLL